MAPEAAGTQRADRGRDTQAAEHDQGEWRVAAPPKPMSEPPLTIAGLPAKRPGLVNRHAERSFQAIAMVRDGTGQGVRAGRTGA